MTGSVAAYAPLLGNLLRDGNDVELPNIWSAVCKKEESEGAKGGEIEITRMKSAVSMGGEHVGVMHVSKLLKNPFVFAKGGILLCQNENLHHCLLFTSSGQTANQRNHLNSLL